MRKILLLLLIFLSSTIYGQWTPKQTRTIDSLRNNIASNLAQLVITDAHVHTVEDTTIQHNLRIIALTDSTDADQTANAESVTSLQSQIDDLEATANTIVLTHIIDHPSVGESFSGVKMDDKTQFDSVHFSFYDSVSTTSSYEVRIWNGTTLRDNATGTLMYDAFVGQNTYEGDVPKTIGRSDFIDSVLEAQEYYWLEFTSASSGIEATIVLYGMKYSVSVQQ